MTALIVIVQLLIAFCLAAIATPAILLNVPAARSGSAGPVVALGIGLAAFVAMRLAWPRKGRAASKADSKE